MLEEMLSPDSITDRQRDVLRIVIQEFVSTAQPVGSSSIVHQHDLGVSAATIRNDLAALEQLGLLTHPHTSAGRVPTDLGFRFFVQHLLNRTQLEETEQNSIRREFGLVPQDIEQWLRLSTAVLARASRSAALATTPRSVSSTFKHMELVHINGTKVLLVLVLQEGTVKQQLLDLDEEMGQSELSRVSNELNAHLIGCDAAGLPRFLPKLSPFAIQVAALVAETMQRLDQGSRVQVFRDGLIDVLRAPEFAEGETMRKIVQVLEQPYLIEQIAEDASLDSTVHVVIAGDGRYEQLRDVSLVLARYGASNRLTGLLGVVGPVRMWYGRTIGAVGFVSELMTEIVEETYGA